jgi:ubiquinone/menaquinone biosynthesis C-methylase UbiE
MLSVISRIIACKNKEQILVQEPQKNFLSCNFKVKRQNRIDAKITKLNIANALARAHLERKLLLTDPWYRLIVRMMESVINDFNSMRIIEIGCGFGGFSNWLAKRGADVIGLDISSIAIRKAKNFAKQSGVRDRVDFVVGDARFLPFKSLAGDCIVCSETLEHVSNYEKAFAELVRLAKKSGYLCVTIPNLFSTLIFEEIVLLLIGQPKYVKKELNVETEQIFNLFKLKKLIYREDLKVIKIQSTDFLHIPPTVKGALRIGRYVDIVSDQIENHLEKANFPLKLFGSNIGLLARKVSS